jgi:hypothetical protein
MNEELIKTFCDHCVEFCDSHNLGLYMVLSYKEGLVHLNKFPDWSVLQHSDERESIKLHHSEDDSPEEWFNKVHLTVEYLDALSKDSEEMSALSSNLKDSLVTVLTQVFSRLEEPKTTLH